LWIERFAPAKVNLYLHVGPVAADGYHPVSSLMAFADVGDTVRLRPAAALGFGLEGPFAEALALDADNLVTRARDRFLACLGQSTSPFELSLVKSLPIAAGLGGGSADAAAALRLLSDWLSGQGLATPGDDMLTAIARDLGADVAACLMSRALIGRGRGDEITPAPLLPPLDAVLVNPGAPSPTGRVYRAFDESAAAPSADDPELPTAFTSTSEVVALLEATRNDLEAPAVALEPLIGQALEALAGDPDTMLARMSGSGATCFAICADQQAALRLAARIATRFPGWWVQACRFR
jgi:4-diphosphocytidyl-2-C-methyl-D-erythritol kinase